MTSSTAADDERSDSGTNGRRFLTRRAPLLRLRLTDFPDGSGRATLYPPDVADIVRMETWLTVDASVVRELSNCR